MLHYMLVLSQLITLTKGVYIDEKAENILHQLLAEYEKNPADGKYDNIINFEKFLFGARLVILYYH